MNNPNLKNEANFKLCNASLMLAKMAMKTKNSEFGYKIKEYHEFICQNLHALFALKTNLKVGLQLVLFYVSPSLFENLFMLKGNRCKIYAKCNLKWLK